MTYSDIVLMILAVTITWSFTIYYLFNGRKIEVICSQGKNNRLINSLTFFLVSVVIVIRVFNLYGIISACLITLAGLLFASIPSGFNDDGIFLNGRFYPFKKMEELEYANDTKPQIRFSVKRKYHILFGEDSDSGIFKDIQKAYYRHK